MYKAILFHPLFHCYSLSELPECQLPLAMRRDVVDQTMAIALHPVYDCKTAIVSASLILCLTQSPEAHVHLARKELVKDMMEMCALKRKMVMESLPQPQGEKEDPMSICALE